MGKTWEEVVVTMNSRRQSQSVLIRTMLEVQRRYDGDWIMPLPNQDDEPDFSALGPSLIADAVEHLALKAASQTLSITVPALDPAKMEMGPRSVPWANIRRKAAAATLYRNQAKLVQRTAYKHMVGYATFTMGWIPDFEKESRTYCMPRLVVRDPKASFPEPKAAYDITPPRDIGFISALSAQAITSMYGWIHPDIRRWLEEHKGAGGSNMWDVCEWVDREDVIVGILGPHYANGEFGQSALGYGSNGSIRSHGSHMELTRWRNEAGVVPFVCPQQVTMSRVASAVARNIGQSDMMNKLVALDLLATEKSILPDRYVIGKNGKVPFVVGGERWKDGRTGETNIVMDAEAIGLLHQTTDPTSKQAIDRRERDFRVSTGLAPQWGSESFGAMRTGRGQDALSGYATDPRIAELHEQMEAATGILLEAAFAMYEGYWPDKKYTVFSGWEGDRGHVDFTPKTHFPESHEIMVNYPIPGMDVQGLTLNLGQLLAAKAISKRTFRKKHPYIDDAEGEERQSLLEELQAIAFESLGQLVMSGSTPPEDLARIGQSLAEEGDVFKAMILVGELAQARQAEQAEMPTDEMGMPALGPGGQPLALPPGSMPGLGPPGAGMEQMAPGGMPTHQPPSPSSEALRMVVRNLKQKV